MLQNISKNNFLNYLFCFIPISFIAGNLILNLNILALIAFTIFFNNNSIFKIKFNLFDKIVIIFFLYLLILLIIKGYSILVYGSSEKELNVFVKTLAYFRFLILYFILKFLVLRKILNFKFFFIVCTGCTLFICLDMILQIYTGKDIFGFELTFRRASGPFGDELIAGSYLQRFSIFSFFLLYFYPNSKNKIFQNLLSLSFLCLTIFCIIFSGNKMPLALFLSILILIFVFEKVQKKIFFSFVVLSPLIFILIFYTNPVVKDHFGNFFTKANSFLTITEFDPEKEKNRILTNKNMKVIEDHQYYIILGEKKYEMKNTYMKDFYSGYKTWQLNKYIGEGVRSYRNNCSKTDVVNCSPHPHNYYIDILANLGLVGLVILIILFLKIFINYFYTKFVLKRNFKDQFLIIPFFYLFIAEIFPFRTSGSFFTTSNATFIFLIISITIALITKKT